MNFEMLPHNLDEIKIAHCPHVWISVEDRLPEISNSVLVYQHEDKINNGIYVAWIEKLGIDKKPIWQYSWCCGCYVPKEVTHWMPLPLSPENKS